MLNSISMYCVTKYYRTEERPESLLSREKTELFVDTSIFLKIFYVKKNKQKLFKQYV